MATLKTKSCQFDNFVVIGGTVSCRDDNLRCHQRRQSCQIDDILFSVLSPVTPQSIPSTDIWFIVSGTLMNKMVSKFKSTFIFIPSMGIH